MANVFSVSNSEDLMNALASATGGDTIELAGGDYGDLFLKDGKPDFDVTFDTEVTIRSANADQPASFSGMDLRGVSNLTFDGLVFDYQFSQDDPSWIRPFQVGHGSSDITIRNSVFNGDLASGISEIDDGYGYGIGLSVRSASNISIENNEFFNWLRGAVYSQTENLSVVGNEVYAIRMDGFNFAEVQSVLIEGNYIHDFRGSPDSSDHRDMIQFWTNGTTSPSSDVIIRDNILDIGDGTFTQSIFMRNEEVDHGRAGVEMFYQNMLIENNTIYNGHGNGISVGETDGLTIRNNAVLKASGDANDLSGSVSIPRIHMSSASTSVVIEGNITSAISGGEVQPGWTVSGNALIQPSDYLEQFITSTIDAENGPHGFIVLPESEIGQLGAGSSGVQLPDAPDTLTPHFQVNSSEESAQTLIFDASLTVGPLGPVSESDAEFRWDFGDGGTATGQIVNRELAAPGHHDVTLTVVANDGTTAQAEVTAGVAGNDIVQFDAQAGLFEALAYGEERALDGSGLPLQGSADGYALKLGGEGTQASIARSELSNFFGTDSFEMSMTLKADNANSWGEIARIHTSFITSIDQNGNFKLDIFPDDGSRARIATEGVKLNDGAAHDVVIQFDGKAGLTEILIDDQLVASEFVSGHLSSDGTRPLIVGNPWGGQNFDGELSAFTLSAESRDFPVYEGDAVPVSSTETGAPGEAPAVNSGETGISEPTGDENTATTPESDSTLTEPEEDSSLPEPLLKGGYQLDFASVTTSDTVQLHDDAHPVETEDGLALSFDGKTDFISLGRLTEFETSQKLGFSVDFVSGNADGGAQRLVWNHQKIGLTLEGDGLRVQAQNEDDDFGTGFKIEGLGLNDGNRHTATVMVDAEMDRLQVVVNDALVLDEQGTDFDFVGAGGHEWGWSLGTAWNRWFDGDVYEFQVSDDFAFVETQMTDENVLI